MLLLSEGTFQQSSLSSILRHARFTLFLAIPNSRRSWIRCLSELIVHTQGIKGQEAKSLQARHTEHRLQNTARHQCRTSQRPVRPCMLPTPLPPNCFALGQSIPVLPTLFYFLSFSFPPCWLTANQMSTFNVFPSVYAPSKILSQLFRKHNN